MVVVSCFVSDFVFIVDFVFCFVRRSRVLFSLGRASI